jgi:hypothetical protein
MGEAAGLSLLKGGFAAGIGNGPLIIHLGGRWRRWVADRWRFGWNLG